MRVHRQVRFDDNLALISALALASEDEPADIETFGNVTIGTALDVVLAFDRPGADLGRMRTEDRFIRLAGETRMETSASLAAGTRLAPDPTLCLRSITNGESCGIKLDLRLAFSVRKGPIFDRRREFLLVPTACGTDGARRAGLGGRGLLFETRRQVPSLLLLPDESSGVGR